ncbi:MAG: hypothetical protein L0Y79_10835 [Chlorobi bacterium]|nr:hypothetical protein [Chlorobiota bacterium]
MIKILVLASFLFISSLFNPCVQAKGLNPADVNLTRSASKAIFCDEYVYVRVLINGVWWIYVYLDGHLVFVYPDEDD